MEAEVVVIFTPLINISSAQGWESHRTRYLGSPEVTDGTAEEVVDTNPSINIVFRHEDITISFKVIELIMEKTCEGTAYSHLYYKRELRNYYVTIPVILSAEPANVHDIGH